MCRKFIDVFDKEYNLSEAIKVIPEGHKCYKVIKDKNGVNQTELCPFLDWLRVDNFHREEDFHCKGFCHLLKRGDWFNKELGKDTEYLQLHRTSRSVKVDSTTERTEFLWDCVKNCHINEEE